MLNIYAEIKFVKAMYISKKIFVLLHSGRSKVQFRLDTSSTEVNLVYFLIFGIIRVRFSTFFGGIFLSFKKVFYSAFFWREAAKRP